ncbi:recombinase family protein [Oscillospiraceae bacterium 50-58]
MNTTRSDRIKAGLQKSFRSGKSTKASIVCYGYRVDSKGKLQIYPAETAHVFYIFERFAAGDSLGKISDALFLMDIPSPAGKEIWSKETLRKILSNEKYKGCVTLQKTFVENYLEHRQIKNKGQLDIYQIDCNHSPIIYTEN